MKFNKEDIESMCFGDCFTGFEIIEEGDWISEGKYEYKEVIFKFEDKLYSIGFSRSGSSFSDYYYDIEDWDNEVECPEVEAIEVKKIVYRIVKR